MVAVGIFSLTEELIEIKMKRKSRSRWIFAACLSTLLLLAAIPRSSYAISITGIGKNGLGSFTGTFEYTGINSVSATLVVSLTNTSPAGTGFFTAFAFNNPGGISGVSLASTSGTFNTLLGGPGFSNGVSASPYGDFDIGVGTGNSWLGGGSPNGGIALGDMETFTFALIGTDLNLLTIDDFTNELSSSAGGGGAQFFVARFKGIQTGEGSDKAPTTVVPEPGTLLLLGSGLTGLGLIHRRRKSA